MILTSTAILRKRTPALDSDPQTLASSLLKMHGRQSSWQEAAHEGKLASLIEDQLHSPCHYALFAESESIRGSSFQGRHYIHCEAVM